VQSLSNHINQYVFDSDTKVFISKNIGDFFWHLGRIAPIGALHANGGLYSATIYADLLQHATDQNLVKTEAE
jgi:hypothetical protein